MKLLITGGCGFLGSNIAAHFLGNDAEVVVADGLFRAGSSQNLEWLKSKAKAQQLHFERGDVADSRWLDDVVARHAPYDFVCHVAGQVAMTKSIEDPRRDFATNAFGTFNLLESIRRHSPDAVVAFSSTNKVYGDLLDLRYGETPSRYTTPDFPAGLDEKTPLDFTTPYGCSKGAADQYVRDWSRVFGLKTVVFRHSSIYGGRQFATYDQGWIGWFCHKAIEQHRAIACQDAVKPFTISGTGKQVRDVLHARDLVSLYSRAYENRVAAAGRVFNIGGGVDNSLSLLELFELLAQILKLPNGLVFEKLAPRQSDQKVFIADCRLAAEVLGWRPLVSSAEGINEMIEWTRSVASSD
jgi:CDP-paratose 2-epimerase